LTPQKRISGQTLSIELVTAGKIREELIAPVFFSHTLVIHVMIQANPLYFKNNNNTYGSGHFVLKNYRKLDEYILNGILRYITLLNILF
jgi:hypothetical protein